MTLGRRSYILLRALPCFIALAMIPAHTAPASRWDTDGARRAFLKAGKQYAELIENPDASPSKYTRCTENYRKAYCLDPHYEHAADAVYFEGRVYQKMGDIFKKNRYYLLAVKRFEFLVSDYGGNTNCPEALLRIGNLYSGKLNNSDGAQKAYRILRTRYGSSGIKPPEDLKDPAALLSTDASEVPKPKAPKAPSPQKSIVSNIRHWSSNDYTRLVIVMDSEASYEKNLLYSPNRMYFDIEHAELSDDLRTRSFAIKDKFLKRVRVGQYNPDVVRIVLDFSVFSTYSIFRLQSPSRIVIDLHHTPAEQAKTTKPQPPAPSNTDSGTGSRKASLHEEKTASVITEESSGKAVGTDAAALLGKTVPLAELLHKDLPESPKAAEPTSFGRRTLTRTLGLKIGRIVIDPGHGGHDLGTVGPGGLLEKDLVLSLAFKLKTMLEKNLGFEVILTREEDVFVSLEERTEIANRNQADLFISIHANSSRYRSISGVETYYLDFARTESEREVAARENAGAGSSISDLEHLVEQIARADKASESKELASLMQNRLYDCARTVFVSTKDRGVRRAPFMVLIGAKMPSILTEVAFISNPKDERALNEDNNRDSLAEALYSGIESYMKKLGSYPIAYQTVQSK